LIGKYLKGRKKIKVDIVGGGIAGLSSAISLKEHDKSIEIIVHEKHKKIGYNHEGRRCGEGHTVEREWKKWKPSKKSIFNNIAVGDVTVGKKRYIIPTKPQTSCILNRQEFICQLARRAKKLGAIIKANDRIKSISELDGNYIIDASGCPSTVKRELGLRHGITGVTYQQTLEKSNVFVADTVKVFYTGIFGYYWIFPRDPIKKEINIGVGLFSDGDYNLKELLETFKQKHGIGGKINYVTGGLIAGGLQRPLRYRNILFVGDAGVGAFPFTGQGIYRALISGDIAGACITKNRVNKYPHIINQNFIKWDLIGKTFIKANSYLKNINPKLVLASMNYFIGANELIHL